MLKMLIMITVMVMISYHVQGNTDFDGVTLVCEDGWKIYAHNIILACSDDNDGDIDDGDEWVMISFQDLSACPWPYRSVLHIE